MAADTAMAISLTRFDESLTQVLGAYRMDNLVDSYISDTNSEAGSVVLVLSAKMARMTNTMADIDSFDHPL